MSVNASTVHGHTENPSDNAPFVETESYEASISQRRSCAQACTLSLCLLWQLPEPRSTHGHMASSSTTRATKTIRPPQPWQSLPNRRGASELAYPHRGSPCHAIPFAAPIPAPCISPPQITMPRNSIRPHAMHAPHTDHHHAAAT